MANTNTPIDPMMDETPNELKEKSELWTRILLECPETADNIIRVFKENGAAGIAKLDEHLTKYSVICAICSELIGVNRKGNDIELIVNG